MRRDWGLWLPQRALAMEKSVSERAPGREDPARQRAELTTRRGSAPCAYQDEWASDETRLWDFSSSTLSARLWNVIIIHQFWTQSGVPEADAVCRLESTWETHGRQFFVHTHNIHIYVLFLKDTRQRFEWKAQAFQQKNSVPLTLLPHKKLPLSMVSVYIYFSGNIE